MILRAVADLRPGKQLPSRRWLQRFLKDHPEFHTIHTKSLNTHRKQAQNKASFEAFFQKYINILERDQIKPRNLWNVDETGYMIGCYKGTEVIVPIEVKHVSISIYVRSGLLLELAIYFYTNSIKWTVDNPENRTSVTIFEAINAEGYALPECIVISGKLHMDSWYTELEPDALIIINDSGYTNENIATQYIHHFLQQSAEYRGPPEEKRLLILDGHSTHRGEQFLTIAEEYNITVLDLPAHATHLLQPLDVKVFKQCKHFHQKAIDEAVHSFDFEYKLRTFLSDLPRIRRQSLTIRTILSGWKASGLWPVNPALIIDKIQEERNTTPEYEFDHSYNLTTPKTSMQTVSGVEFWQQKTELLFSSPSRHAFESFARGTTVILHRAELYKTELDIVQLKAMQQREAKARARKSLQSGGQLYAHEARALREERERKALAKVEAKAARESAQAAKQLLQMARRSAIEDRKAERKRVADRRALGLRSKVVVLKYRQDKSDSEDSNEEAHDIDSDNSSVVFRLSKNIN
jgi:hypothetical protein